MLARHDSCSSFLFLAGTIAVLVVGCARSPITIDDGESGTGSDGGSCIAGEADCECNAGLCLAGLECVDNICVSPTCTPGELGCECNGGLCLAGLECVDNVCMEPGGDGDGDGDPGDGDGDGDGDGGPGDGDGAPGDGDGDGDGDGSPDPCGNGNIDLGEDCDDGNAENGDGCNNDCTESGALLWQDVFSVFTDDDFAQGVAVDSSDQIFVSGYSRVLDSNIDGWYRKYSADGQLFWDDSFGGPGGDGCYRVAVDPDDDVLVACFVHNGVNTDAMLRKLDQNGAEIWTRQFHLIANDTAFGVAVAVDGTIVVTGGSAGTTGFVRRYDTNGVEIWTQSFNIGPRGRDVGHLANGNIAVAIDSGRRARVYTPAGAEVWTYGQNTCNAIGLGVAGNEVLLAGCDAVQPSTAWFGWLDAGGNLTWDETWAGDTYAYANDIAVDSTGRIVVIGIRSVLNQGIMISTRKYSADGQTLIWEQTLHGAKVDGNSDGISVTIDSQDNVIVCGYLEQDADWDAVVAKYSP